MAELPNRDQLEQNFAKKFGRVARRHMHEYRELLGNPPDPNNVPKSFYKKMQDEVDRDIFAILLLIWSDSAEYHGWGGYDMSVAAMGWAATRSQDLGKYWAESTRDRLEKGFEKIREKKEAEYERTIDEARETNARIPSELRQTPRTPTGEESGRLKPYVPSEPPNIERDELNHLLEMTFGPKRVEKIAVNETTAARGSGGEAAVHATGTASDEDMWVNPDDSRTCNICHPLVFTKRPEWSLVAPDGPPPPDSECYCRCWIKYAPVAATKSLKSYNPSEARDEHGQWTSNGSSRSLSKKPSLEERYGISENDPHLDTIQKYDDAMQSAMSKWSDEYKHSGHDKLVDLLGHKFSLNHDQKAYLKDAADDIQDFWYQHDLDGLSPSELAHRVSEKTLQRLVKVATLDKGEYRDVWGDKVGAEKKSFDADAWHRTIHNAAEWRAYCFENGIDHEDRSAFKSFALQRLQKT